MNRALLTTSLLLTSLLSATAHASIISITDDSANLSVNGVPYTGTAFNSPTASYQIYKQSGTSLIQDNSQPLTTILQGNLASPGGNLELFADSETTPLQNFTTFQTYPYTILSGTLNSTPIKISSLNGNDWFTTSTNTYSTSFGANNLANQWFNDFLSNYNFTSILTNAGYTPTQINTQAANLFNTLVAQYGFQRISDPNISYVNQNTATNEIDIGLAGTLDYLNTIIPGYLESIHVDPSLAPANVNASEVVKIIYNNQTPLYDYSFTPSPSGLTTDDSTKGYNAEFNVTATAVPEPASLSLLALLLIPLRRKRLSKKCG